jgi:hypothetical protein
MQFGMPANVVLRDLTVRVGHDDRIVSDQHAAERLIAAISGLTSEIEGSAQM